MSARDPAHDEAEISVVGSMLLGSEAADQALGMLTREDFRHPAHGHIFRAIESLRKAGHEPEPLAVREELERDGLLDASGGAEYLARIVDIVPTAVNLPYFAARVAEASYQRRLLAATETIQKAIRSNGQSPTALHAWATQEWAKCAPAVTDGPTYRTMADYLTDPDILKPPAAVIPRISWRSRLAMLSGEEKLGKSTFLAAGVAAATTGTSFLGEHTEQAVIAYCTIDEPVPTTITNLHRFEANPSRVYIVTDADLGADRLQGVANAVRRLAPDALVIDSLWKFTAGVVTDSKDAAAWAPVLDKLTSIAHDFHTGVTFTHHARKSDGRYRDSSAIGAACDVLLEMLPGDGYTREIKVRARWPMDDFSIRLNGDARDYAGTMYYTLAGVHELPRGLLVYRFVESHPGCSKRQVRQGVPGRAAEIDAELENQALRGLLRDEKDGAGSHYFANEAGHGWDTSSDTDSHG